MEKFSIRYLDQFGNLTLIKRELDGDMDIFTLKDYFIEFLRGASFSEKSIDEIFNIE